MLAAKSKSANPVGMEDDAIKICEEKSRRRLLDVAQTLQPLCHFLLGFGPPPWSGDRRFTSFSIVCSTNSSTEA